MKAHELSRRETLHLGTKLIAATAFGATLSVPPIAAQNKRQTRIFDVLKYGAAGDGATLDSAAFQKAIDEAGAAGPGAQVLVRGGHRYLIGTLVLRGGIDFHLADDAELLASTRQEHYTGGALLTAQEANGLRISGTGSVNGRAKEFMVDNLTIANLLDVGNCDGIDPDHCRGFRAAART
jgi:polygalacturonase